MRITPPRFLNRHLGLRTAIVITCVFLSTAVLGVFFFVYNQYLTTKQLKEQLMDLASVAALQFDSADMERVRTENDIDTPAFRRLSKQLYDITQKLPDVRFAYLMRRTEDPMTLRFIADSDLFMSLRGMDTNHDGHIDSDEAPSLPGTPYSIVDVPKLQGPAFETPTTDDVFTGDQWGTFLSAYAPIRDSRGVTIAVLGLDMDALKFQRLSQRFFRPTVFLLVMLLGLAIAALVGVSMWKRQLESVMQLEEDRTSLINLAMHQLGAPLAIVRWWLEILCESEDCKKPDACRHCEICTEMKEGVARLTEVMTALKEVSELDSAHVIVSHQSGLIEDAIAIIRHDFASRFAAQKKTMIVHDDARHSLVALDKTLLVGVLRELIGNAFDYSPEGATVTITTQDTALGTRILVSDTGYGIPQKDLPHIFQKFSRGSNATRYKTEGNGIGLYVVKSIIEKAGGKISIESDVGKGTSVSITLPRVRA